MIIIVIIVIIIINQTMLYKASFWAYSFLLLLYSIYTGLNHYRIQAKGKIHPQVVTTLFPFMVNFIMAKLVFTRIDPLFSTLLPCVMIFLVGLRMKKIRIFGLTGGIACGKSTLVKLMEQNLGDELAIIDCDKINGELRLKGQSGYNLILKLLKEDGQNPEDFINNYNQEIKRQLLSDYSFEHPPFLRKLTAKLGLHIFWEILKQVVSNAYQKKKLILIDAPTLYETKVLTHICFPIIVVGCEEETQVTRMMENRKLSEEQARLRMSKQMPLSLKMQKADIYVENEGRPEEMFVRTVKGLNKILQMGKK